MPRILHVPLLFLALSSAALAGDPPAAAADPRAGFDKSVKPYLVRYCYSCHSGDEARGGLDLPKLGDASALARNYKAWERVAKAVTDATMPPLDSEPQPADEESTAFTSWLESALSSGLCGGEPDPGHVTLRRLNRAEYDNTIRDLLGVDFHPSRDFPTDDVGYGFDNIGDVLTLSPLLLEKYVDAAEQIAGRTILLDRTSRGEARDWPGAKLEGDGSSWSQSARFLGTTGTALVPLELTQSGLYRIRVRAFANQGGDEPARMAILAGDKELARFDVPNTEDEPRDFDVETTLDAGNPHLGIRFLNDFYDPNVADEHHRDRNLIVDTVAVVGPIVPNALELPESHRRLIFREPADPADRAQAHDAARAVLDRLVSRAYRRPANDRELDRLLEIVDQGMGDDHNFARGIQAALTAVLVSPRFLFRVEFAAPGTADPKAAPQANQVRTLSDFELASRLSYFLWSSMPDDELFDLARQGKLHQDDVLSAQVRRMLADPKLATGLVDNFAMQWLQLRVLANFTPSREIFPDYDEKLRDDMITETRLFFESVAREDRSILDFIDSRDTFLNARLARFYGVPGVEGDEFRKVQLPPDSPRGGLITQASVLAATSNPSRTSPVKRGKWIMEAILGTPPPPPPPNVPPLSEDKAAMLAGSLRERMERHRADAACATCHEKMDPLGFGFENFNAIGQWRDKDGEFPVDPSGVLPSGSPFSGPVELKQQLRQQAEGFRRALAEKMLTFALGRGLEAADRCVVDAAAQAARDHEDRFSNLVLAIVQSAPFRMTRTEGNTR